MNHSSARWKALLFDLDGTLLDTRALVAAAYLHTFREILDLEIAESDVMRDYGRPLRYTFARYAPPAKVEEMLRVYREYNLLRHDEMATLFPGVAEGLRQIQTLGLPLGLVTSKKRAIAMRGLELHHIETYFELVVCEEDTAKHKPEPEPLLFAARRLGLLPEELLYVGDSPYDIMCANEAGAAAVAVQWSTFKAEELLQLRPTFFLSTLGELANLLSQ